MFWHARQEQGVVADTKPHTCAAMQHQYVKEADQRMGSTHSTGTFLVGSVKLLIWSTYCLSFCS